MGRQSSNSNRSKFWYWSCHRETLVDHGLIVVGLARRVERIKDHAKKLSNKKGKLYAIETNLSKEEDILEAFKKTTENFGTVHLLVNNAGIVKEGLLTEGRTEDWKTKLDVNVLAPCIATREAIKIMKVNNISGDIININSIAGLKVSPVVGSNIYAATKFALTALTETLRQELNHLQSKIRVTSWTSLN